MNGMRDWQRCANCNFAGEVPGGRGNGALAADDTMVMVCRASPPATRIQASDDGELVSSIFPPTHVGGWCGAWSKYSDRVVPR